MLVTELRLLGAVPHAKDVAWYTTSDHRTHGIGLDIVEIDEVWLVVHSQTRTVGSGWQRG